jgi:hypothetical protein
MRIISLRYYADPTYEGVKKSIDSVEAISFDPYTHGYYKVSGRVGDAFKDGMKLK